MAVVKLVLTDGENENVNITTELDSVVDEENLTGSQILALQILDFLRNANEITNLSEQKETE